METWKYNRGRTGILKTNYVHLIFSPPCFSYAVVLMQWEVLEEVLFILLFGLSAPEDNKAGGVGRPGVVGD